MPDNTASAGTAAPARRSVGELRHALREFLALRAARPDAYLDSKTLLAAGVDELLRAYSQIRADLPRDGRILDWGCRHAALGFLARMDGDASLQIDGCDVCEQYQYAPFHARVGLTYARITHPWRLDYADASFDAVIAGGTLEHVPNDGESLTELWRVLKPDGALLITHLPNVGSWSECVSRWRFPAQAHLRRYRLREFRARLLQHGFAPQRWGYHQLAPASVPVAWSGRAGLTRLLQMLQPLNRFENRWPLRRLSATLWLVVRKRDGF